MTGKGVTGTGAGAVAWTGCSTPSQDVQPTSGISRSDAPDAQPAIRPARTSPVRMFLALLVFMLQIIHARAHPGHVSFGVHPLGRTPFGKPVLKRR